jgi:hypothetical protein
LKRLWWTLCAGLVAAACGEESPTEVGTGLLPVDAIQTFEVILDADRYLVWDTAFGNYSAPADADYAILANAFEGALHSRVLLRFTIPTTLVVTDTAGVQRVDSVPIFTGGLVQMVVDTLASSNHGAVQVFHATESWDRGSADWTLRVDTQGVRLPWAQPGGSRGALIGSADWLPGADTLAADTVSVPVDSAAIAVWADTLNANRGAVISMGTAGTRLRTSGPSLLLRARSTHRPDTIYEVRVTPTRTFIFTPELTDAAGMPRVGGQPAWRGVLRLRERLDTLTVPCPSSPGCRVQLGEVAISHASLLLQPQPPPAGYSPELDVQMSVHLLLPTPLVPLQRSPLTEAISITTTPIPISRFQAPGAPLVELPFTDVVSLAVAPPGTSATEQRATHVALVQAGIRTFGFAQFESQPQLRLILTTAKELQLP